MLALSVLLCALTGSGLSTPLRYAASVIMRDEAFTASPLWVVVAGLGVHASASLLFGALFGLVASDKRRFVRERVQGSALWSCMLGLGAGLLIWLVDVQLVARWFYPWFGVASPSVLLLHLFGFGVPLGVSYHWLRRRRHLLGQEPTRYPNQAVPLRTSGHAALRRPHEV